jgi:putative NADPH-quinone reductase
VSTRITIIDGHPDPSRERLCHALANAYAQGAGAAGHAVRRLTVAELDFPVLRAVSDWTRGEAVADIRQSQDAIRWARHLVIIYPLWLGSMPALLKAFLEQVFRAGFAVDERGEDAWPKPLLKGRSARIVVTMGMPALAYRWFFLAHSLRSLERNILRFSGIGPIRETLIGGVGGFDQAMAEKWLARLRGLGESGR